MRYRPPFEVTPSALHDLVEIMRLAGRYEGGLSPVPQPQLRRKNRIRTVQASVAIEGNRLTAEQVTAILDHRAVVGPARDIREVQNAIAAYDLAPRWHPHRERDLLSAHRTLMDGLSADAGHYRTTGVGILRGTQVAHVAPPARRVPKLVSDLLAFAKSGETQAVVRSAVLHYELEFIHPFSDGNGRMGRLWQHVALLRAHPVFAHLPFESMIHARQAEYYRVLRACDRAGSSTRFIAFALGAIRAALEEFVAEVRAEPFSATSRLDLARAHFGSQTFTRRDYLALFKRLSTATASRDLREGVERRALKRKGDKSLAEYRFRS